MATFHEITLFNKALNLTTLDYEKVNQLAITKGYVVSKECCNERVISFLQSLPDNYNTTFYKSWSDVTSKSRFELVINQILYYIHIYSGLIKFDIPNDGGTPQIDFTDCKVILPITKEEIQIKVQSMFDSGIALKQETIEQCLNLFDELGLYLNHQTIKNKEVMMFICKKMDVLPTSPMEMVRYLIYLYTDKTLLINNNETIKLIKQKQIDITPLVEQFGIATLSSVFLRYKNLFLAMKKGNEKIINKLKRLSSTYHKPFINGFWSTVLSQKKNMSDVTTQLQYLNNYKLVSLIQTTNVRLNNTGVLPVKVRNGKLFVTDYNGKVDREYYYILCSILYDELVLRLSKKACKVKMPQEIQLTFPTSEKNFVGNVPFGSKVNLGNYNVVLGIHRKPEQANGFLDLSLMGENGVKYGWNSHFYNEDKTIVFSGDIQDQSKTKEVAEMFYGEDGLHDNLTMLVNNYEREDNIIFRMFVAKSKIVNLTKNYMVNPNDIVFSTELETTSKQMMIGFINHNYFYFSNLRMGNKTVSYGNQHISKFLSHQFKTCDTYVEIGTVLADAGYEFVDEDYDIDLSTLDKSVIIDLLK